MPAVSGVDRRQPVRDRHHERVPAGAEAALERAHVQQHPVADTRRPDQRRVRKRANRRPVHGYHDFGSSGPFAPQRRDSSASPSDHDGRLAAGRHAGPQDRSECHGRRPMSKRRTERLLSIVVLLLSSRRYLTAEQIRAAVSGYPDEHEAFKRMFERDKEELRELGIPLETGGATRSTTSSATGSAARTTSCPRSSWSRRGGRARHRLPGLAVGRAGRAPPPARCSSSRPRPAARSDQDDGQASRSASSRG